MSTKDDMGVFGGANRAENGNLVASGTYYFVVNLIYGTIEETFKDYVVVVRE